MILVRRTSPWLAAVLLAAVAGAAEPDRAPAPAAPPAEARADPLAGGLDDLEPWLRDAVGPEREAQLAVLALDAGRMIRARELAEQLLDRDPESIAGHCVLGQVLAIAEGNLSAAAHHLERCLEAYERRYGEPAEGDPWLWHRLALENLLAVHVDMARHEEALEYVDRLEASYGDEQRHRRGWPLFQLRRLGAAREVAEELLEEVEDPALRAIAWHTLCAVAGEEYDRETAYETCLLSLEIDREDPDPVRFTNAAEAAKGLLRADEAERLLLEATGHFARGSVAIPWTELTYLYLEQGRLAEALAATREALAWRSRQPAWTGALNWTMQDVAAAHLLLIAGRPLLAARLSARALDQPDRGGRYSAEHAQVEGATALLDRVANRTAAELRAEEASASSGSEFLRPWLASLRHRLRAWQSGRRARAHFASRRLLESRLAPHAPGFVVVPEWLDLDLVAVLGPGVVEAALTEWSGAGGPPGGEGYRVAFAAEAAHRAGRHEQALARVETALRLLPRWETLLRARLAATGAAAARAEGEASRALELLGLAWQIDPGVIRREGLALPTRFETSGGAMAREAVRRLRRSPRLEPARAGFVVRVQQSGTELQACLEGPQGAVLRCARTRAEAGEDAGTSATRLAREFHATTFAPRVDLTQADIRSLDGSTVASGGQDAQVRIVLDHLLGDDEAADGGP